MKKNLTPFFALLFVSKFASAQVLPSFEFGVKGGINLSRFSHTATFNTANQAGYLGGVWMRFGAIGLNFQPELYMTSKAVDIQNGNTTNKARFTSIDVPLLLGTKIGAFGVGGRFYTGPLFSFAVNKDQSVGSDLGNIIHLNYKDQNIAWQFGMGLDIKKFSADLRYELGLSTQPYNNNNDQTRVSLFNLTIGYRLFSI